MDLKALQKPIKERYQQDADSARITLRARGSQVESDALSCNIDIGRAIMAAQAHQGVGGAGTGACSGDLLLAALAGCSQITAQMVAEAMGLSFRRLETYVEGDLDLRGTLGIDRNVPVGFTEIRLRLEVEGDVTPEQLASFQRKVERYCVVLSTLRQPPTIHTSLVVTEGTAARTTEGVAASNEAAKGARSGD